MQIYAGITGCEMQVSASSQACALGTAITAAVLAGAHANFPAAQRAMTGIKAKTYKPTAAHMRTYNRLYKLYSRVSDAFGGGVRSADLSRLMKELLAIKAEQR
jgi:L-ribulokinase